MKKLLLAGLVLSGCTIVHHPARTVRVQPASVQVQAQARPSYVASVYADPNQGQDIWVDQAPPAPYDEQIGPPPGPGYVWVDGYWWWDGAQWAWAPGRWQRPPSRGYVWVRSGWVNRGGRYVFYRGGWAPPQRAVGVTYVHPRPAVRVAGPRPVVRATTVRGPAVRTTTVRGPAVRTTTVQVRGRAAPDPRRTTVRARPTRRRTTVQVRGRAAPAPRRTTVQVR